VILGELHFFTKALLKANGGRLFGTWILSMRKHCLILTICVGHMGVILRIRTSY
jgi:hypothetical protein